MFLFNSLTESSKGLPELLEPPKSTDPNKPAPVLVQKVDFRKMGLPEYENRFALVIDNLFTEEECQKLMDAALASSPKEDESKWEVAQVHVGGGRQITAIDYRNSGRIILDSQDVADGILEKLRPYLKEIEVIEKSELHQLYSVPRQKEYKDARLVRLNEQMKFLRYVPGQYFKQHCDGTYYTEDRKDISYYTLQLYLNGDKDTLKGGATRIWTQQRSGLKPRNAAKKAKRDYFDVFPRRGRAIIFEQGTILHSGEEVTEGVKFTMRTDLMYRQVDSTP